MLHAGVSVVTFAGEKELKEHAERLAQPQEPPRAEWVVNEEKRKTSPRGARVATVSGQADV